MKKIRIIYLALLYFFNNLVFSQDSLIVQLTKKCAHSIDSIKKDTFEFPQKRIYIYGEFHKYKRTDELATEIFEKISKKTSGLKVYFIEGGGAYRYLINKYNHNMTSVCYKHGLTIAYDKEKVIRNSLINYKRIYNNDTAIKFIGFDCELSYNYALICLFDIINNSANQLLFNDEKKCFEKEIGFGKSNEKLTKASIFFIHSYLKDSLKYKSNLSLENFRYYGDIIKGLQIGLKIDSIDKTFKTHYEKAELRENYMYNNIVSSIENINPDIVFIHAGLMHTLDVFQYSRNKNPWVSVAEKLARKYGKENICKIGLVKLSSNKASNCTILNKNCIILLKKEENIIDKILDLNYLKPYIKTNYDYAVFIK